MTTTARDVRDNLGKRNIEALSVIVRSLRTALRERGGPLPTDRESLIRLATPLGIAALKRIKQGTLYRSSIGSCLALPDIRNGVSVKNAGKAKALLR